MTFRRRTSAVLAAGVASGVASGLALGVIWWQLAPRVPMVVRSSGAFPAHYQPDGYIADDVSFAVLAMLAGIAVTVGLLVIRREHPISVLAGGLIAGAIGSILMWFVGTHLGSVDIDGLVATTTDEALVEAPLKITMPALVLIWPLAAAFVIVLVTFADWWSERKVTADPPR